MKRGEIAAIGRAAHDIEDELQSLKQAFKRSLPGSLRYNIRVGGRDQVGDSTDDTGDLRAGSLVRCEGHEQPDREPAATVIRT